MVEEEERLGWGGSWLMGEVGGRQGKEELRRQDHAKFIIKVAEEPPPATAAHLFVCAGDKAGMTDRQQSEKDKIASKIYEMSRNSNFLKHAEKLDKDLDERIARLREILVALKPSALHDFTSVTDRQLREWEKERRFDRVIVHVDMDMFFVAVELLERPELSDRPVAVGDVKMISTANYEARKYGVRSAMPGWMGQELCPSLELLPLNFCKYQAVSAKVKEILGEFDPHFSSFSLDEASLDLTDYLLKRLGRCSGSISPEELFAEGEVVVADIRRRIQEATQLTASAGIASNFFLAKVASDINKPDGQFSIHPDKDEVLRFLQDLPLRKLPGVGKVTEKILKELLGVSTCGALMVHRGAVWALFSEKSRKSLLMKCLGIGRSEHDPPAPDGVVTRKVISCERSFAAVGASGLEDVLIKLCQRLGEDMEAKSLQGRKLILKFKSDTFSLQTRSVSYPFYLDSAESLKMVALRQLRTCLKEMETTTNYRLLGVGVGSFRGQMDDPLPKGQKTIDEYKRSPLKKREGEEGTACPICNKIPQGEGSPEDVLLRHANFCAELSRERNPPPKRKGAIHNFFRPAKRTSHSS